MCALEADLESGRVMILAPWRGPSVALNKSRFFLIVFGANDDVLRRDVRFMQQSDASFSGQLSYIVYNELLHLKRLATLQPFY